MQDMHENVFVEEKSGGGVGEEKIQIDQYIPFWEIDEGLHLYFS